MPRAERIEYDNAYYHVMNRGRGRQMIFHGSSYYKAFLEGLAEAHLRFGMEVHAYCLMGNHYHLLLKTPDGNISRAMRHINGVYTQRYNRLKDTDGPLFRGRFKSILIEQDDYLAGLSRYIHRNPVDMKKPLVTKLSDYPWSSYPAYLNLLKSPSWLYCDEIYNQLGYRQRYKGYRIFIEAGVDEEIETLYRKKKYPAIIGSKVFKEEVYARLENAEAVKKLRLGEVDRPDSHSIVAAVASKMDVDEADIYYGKRGKRQVARWVAMRLCQTASGMSLRQIAAVFHVTHISGVSHQISQLRELQRDDQKFDADFQVMEKSLYR